MTKSTHQILLLFALFTTILFAVSCAEPFVEEPPIAPAPAQRQGLEICLAPELAADGELWEQSITKATVFIYRQGDMSVDPPIVKYLFSDKDINQGKALIPMELSFLAGQTVEIYAIVNSNNPNIYAGNKPLTRSELLASMDSNAVVRYNRSSFNDLPKIVAQNGGFTMAGITTVKIEQVEDGVQQIPITVKRTICRIDVDVKTNEVLFKRYVTENLGEPNATLKISAAWLLRTNRGAPVFERKTVSSDDYRAPFTRKDSLTQENKFPPREFYVGGFRFYTYETLRRGAITFPFSNDASNRAVKLWIRAIYNGDGIEESGDEKMLFFAVPVLGGNDQDVAQALNRNKIYQINITIEGLAGAVESTELHTAPDQNSVPCALNNMAVISSDNEPITLNYLVGGGR